MSCQHAHGVAPSAMLLIVPFRSCVTCTEQQGMLATFVSVVHVTQEHALQQQHLSVIGFLLSALLAAFNT